MLIKDKDILSDKPQNVTIKQVKKPKIAKEHMHAAWGDAFDYYLRGITTKYLRFSGRASRLEFWGYTLVSGFLFLILCPLGDYAEIPMLAYYYAAATAIPTVAVAARRLHDINKKAFFYLFIGFLILFSAFFIGYWALIPILLWACVLILLFSKETDIADGLFGPAEDSDEVYGEDNLRIIRKFRFFAVFFAMLIIILTCVRFDDWSTQAEYRSTNDAILEKVAENCQKFGLNDKQCLDAQQVMAQTLKTWSGKTVQQKDIDVAVEKAIKTIQATAAQ